MSKSRHPKVAPGRPRSCADWRCPSRSSCLVAVHSRILGYQTASSLRHGKRGQTARVALPGECRLGRIGGNPEDVVGPTLRGVVRYPNHVDLDSTRLEGAAVRRAADPSRHTVIDHPSWLPTVPTADFRSPKAGIDPDREKSLAAPSPAGGARAPPAVHHVAAAVLRRPGPPGGDPAAPRIGRWTRHRAVRPAAAAARPPSSNQRITTSTLLYHDVGIVVLLAVVRRDCAGTSPGSC